MNIVWSAILAVQVFGAAPPVEEKPPAPTEEIKKLVVQLGDEEWRVREDASSKLKKEGYKALSALLEAEAKNPCLETRMRARRIVASYFGVYCDKKDLPHTPSIWLLDEKQRFPKGVKIEKDEDKEEFGPSPKGWCKEMDGYDLAAHYFRKARKEYNDKLGKEELANGYKIDDGTWINEHIEAMAMRMYIRDSLYKGRTREEVQKMVDTTATRSTTHKNMHRHYGGGSLGSVIPGPAVPKEEVPDCSEYRFHGWGVPF